MPVEEELVQRLERLADQVDINQLILAIYNDLQLLKKAANIPEEVKEKRKETSK